MTLPDLSWVRQCHLTRIRLGYDVARLRTGYYDTSIRLGYDDARLRPGYDAVILGPRYDNTSLSDYVLGMTMPDSVLGMTILSATPRTGWFYLACSQLLIIVVPKSKWYLVELFVIYYCQSIGCKGFICLTASLNIDLRKGLNTVISEQVVRHT